MIGPVATVVLAVAIVVASTGASLAGDDPSVDFVVLSAALVVAVSLTGGFSPRLRARRPTITPTSSTIDRSTDAARRAAVARRAIRERMI